MLKAGNDVAQMMKVVGEEGTTIEDFINYLKSELIDAVYLQQDSFHEVDAVCSAERQQYIFTFIDTIVNAKMTFTDRDSAHAFFHKLTQLMRDWNCTVWESAEFKDLEKKIHEAVEHALATATSAK